MYLIWGQTVDRRMDYVDIGCQIRGRFHEKELPDLILLTMDEISDFIRHTPNGSDVYRDYLANEIESGLASDGKSIVIDEYNHLSQMLPMSTVLRDDYNE